MSKLLQSKFLLGVVAVVVMFVGVAFGAPSQASADCSITTTLRQGSTGVEVVCLQTSLGGLTADGNFGPMTRAAVMHWQSISGLTADGVFGPLSRAVWMANQGNSGAFPPGCNSAVGFSTTTGLACYGGMSNLPAGCSSTSGFSPTTGMSCSVTSNLPAGCSSTSGFSPTTGVACNSSGSSLGGGAGDATITTASDIESTVTEGDNSTKVVNFKVKAEGSDINVSSVRVEFVMNTSTPGCAPSCTGSLRLNRYVDSVEIWQGSTQVGSANVDDFTKDGNTYSKSINLSGAVVRKDAKSDFFVGVTPLSHLDGLDAASNDWNAVVTQVRFSDATGAILTGDLPAALSTTGEFFDFENTATSGDVKVKVSTNGPVAGDYTVSDTGTTSDVPLLKIIVKAEGSDVSFNTLKVDLGSTGVTTDDLMVSNLKLVEGTSASGNEIDSVAPAVSANQTVTFTSSDDIMINEGDTQTYTVFGKIKQILTTTGGAGFDQGDSLTVSMSTPTSSSNFNVEDPSGNSLSTDVSGSAPGENQVFKSQGIIVVVTSMPAPTVDAGIDSTLADDKGVFKVNFDVTANDETVYIPLVANRGAAGGVNYLIQNASTGASYTAGSESGTVLEQVNSQAGVTFLALGCDTGGTPVDCLRINDGSTASLRLTAYENPGTTDSASYRVQMSAVDFFTGTTTAVAAATVNTLTPAQDYRTGSVLIQSQ